MSAAHAIRQTLRRIADAPSLFEEQSFVARSEAIDELELAVLEDSCAEACNELRENALLVKSRLEQADVALFERLRREIRAGRLRGTALFHCIRSFVPPMHVADGRYGHLDTFMTELFLHRPLPAETRPREREMVFYQRTPSRVALEMIARGELTANDVFYDIGSGLGEVAVLTRLLTDAAAKGVEYEPAYCDYARQLAGDLLLEKIEFLNADARATDFSDGTVFFMYTPFAGGMLREVLDRLRAATVARPVRLFTYGPCTSQVAGEAWLTYRGTAPLQNYQLAEFANTNPGHARNAHAPDTRQFTTRSTSGSDCSRSPGLRTTCNR